VFFKADLHTHTTHSDGWLSVESLLRRAILNKIDVLAITDHDTVSGFIEACERNKKYGLKLVPGIELSSQLEQLEVHILGYFIDVNNPELTNYTAELKQNRYNRCQKIVANLQHEGIEISIEDVEKECKGDMFGRPHIAKALIRKKIAKNFTHAFRDFLGNNSPAYEKKFFITPADAISLIHRAGGIASLAHPGNFSDETVEMLLSEKFDALEAVHPSHSSPRRQQLVEIARKHGLPYSGGSDFHGGSATDRGYIGSFYLSKPEFAAIQALVEK